MARLFGLLNPQESMGVAFHNVIIPAGGHLRPCVSLYHGANVVVNFGPDFKYKPPGFSGLNTTITTTERESLQGTDDVTWLVETINRVISKVPI